MVILRGCSKLNCRIREYLDYRSDQGKRRERCHDMRHPQCLHTGVSTKERARRRQNSDEDHRSASRHARQHKPRIIRTSRSSGEPKKVIYVEVLKAI
jgi:hypothetical protein